MVDGEFRRVCGSTIRIFTLTPAELGWRNGVLVGNGPTVIVNNVPDSGTETGSTGVMTFDTVSRVTSHET